jgi:hypothetical protein
LRVEGFELDPASSRDGPHPEYASLGNERGEIIERGVIPFREDRADIDAHVQECGIDVPPTKRCNPTLGVGEQ